MFRRRPAPTRSAVALALLLWAVPAVAAATNLLSRVIEAAGRVELRRGAATNWQALAVNATLAPGDQVRTGPDSRAAIELSDRSIVRVSANAVLLLQPPRGREERRFRLEAGRIFLFNRSRPSSVEFETPLATGAIRGTEFVLSAGRDGLQTDLDLIDGRVELTHAGTTRRLTSGQAITVVPNQPAAIRAIPLARSLPPWSLHFPLVLVPDDLAWADGATNRLARSLARYERGNPQAALAALPTDGAADEATQVFRSALLTAVGSTQIAEIPARNDGANVRAARAVSRLLAIIQGAETAPGFAPATATEWLVHSWERQHLRDPEGALVAARRAAELRPASGLAWRRVAELAFGLERFQEAGAALEASLAAAPELAPAHALRGFLRLERAQPAAALRDFERALELDPSHGGAWLGRGLTQQRLGRSAAAHQSLQRAVALEPLPAAHRLALARSFAAAREDELAGKELRLARTFRPNDPSAWLHTALWHWQQNRLNEAIRALETSVRLNDDRAVFRPESLLDRDRAVRSANLAALYREAGLDEVALRLAARATTDAYADFSGHQLLAGLYRERSDPHAFDLRYETTRYSEHLLAGLLAPAGAANLSRVIDQQEHLRYLEPPRFGVSSRTDYRGNGDWWQRGAIFGNEGRTSYAFDADYRSLAGEQPNGALEQRWLSLQLKTSLSLQDELYFSAGWLERASGDVARYYDPADAKAGFQAEETQRPALLLGYQRRWSPEHRTLLLGSYFDDEFASFDPAPSVLFLQQSGGTTTSVQTPGFFTQDFASRFQLVGGEAQHLWQPGRHTVIAGARVQAGAVANEAQLLRPLPPPVTDDRIEEDLWRTDVYVYDQWRVSDAWSWIGGLAWSRAEFPRNADLPPLAAGTDTGEVFGPRAGLVWNPWSGGLVRAMYSRSLGGLYFDNSVRLEPTQLAGFNQTFRSLAPESVAGLVPGTRFDVASAGFDQVWAGRVFAGAGVEWLASEGARQVGVLTNGTILPIPDSPAQTRQTLDFAETGLTAYAGALLGEHVSLAARYRWSEARLDSRFPEIPDLAAGLGQLEQDVSARLQHGQLTAQWQHPAGWFARWVSDWYRQDNDGYAPGLPRDYFWQHAIRAGYRQPGRRWQLETGVLNLFDTDYRLNPLNPAPVLPRERTFTLGLRLNF